MAIRTYRAERVVSAIRRGSSSPVVAETEAGTFVVKLRGAAQGVPPLIAEIIVAELAGALGLPVPERVLIDLDDSVPSKDRNDELADLLRASRGINLGLRLLSGATDIRLDQLDLIAPPLASLILWLDGLVLNQDRTPRIPKILIWRRGPWLIDHGAALAFQYDWSAVTEQTPREADPAARDHLLFSKAREIEAIDQEAARIVSRDVLVAASAAVPDAFLHAAFPDDDGERVRAAYVAFLWKRLKAPRPFLPGPAQHSLV
jgi:hypothetical protein